MYIIFTCFGNIPVNMLVGIRSEKGRQVVNKSENRCEDLRRKREILSAFQ